VGKRRLHSHRGEHERELRGPDERAKEQGLTNCRFQEGDASNLHELKDHAFDLVVSIFGAMFTPKPFDVAKEMVCVTRRP